ncbi:unnamed protein product [Heterobilharzia americana]|nr:unnamed protein product [Heterobilharzia americana]
MRLPLNSRISQIRNDLFRISGIPVPSQIWSVKPQNNLLVNEQIPSNAVLDSLVIHLNHRFNQQQKHRSTSSKLQDSSTTLIDVAPVQTSIRDNPTLADLGLKSGDVCELCLTASHPFNNAKNASKTLSFQNDPIQFKPLSSTQQQQNITVTTTS